MRPLSALSLVIIAVRSIKLASASAFNARRVIAPLVVVVVMVSCLCGRGLLLLLLARGAVRTALANAARPIRHALMRLKLDGTVG